jgi:CDP-glucose 4,6-dehydratase
MENLGLKQNNLVNLDYWSSKNIFITGATGFLGSWLIKYLLSTKCNIIALIRDWIYNSDLIINKNINKINVVHGNIEDYFLIERTINEFEIDTIFHLAAQTIVEIANNNPLSTFETNIRGTWNLLEACRRNRKVKRIIIASSDKAYGNQKDLPYDENFPLKGIHPYDVSKSCADLLSNMYHKTYKLPVGITRCGNFYGGGDINFNRIIPGTIRSLLNNERPVLRSDGSYIRDYLYIEDAVLAYLLLAEKMDDKNIHGEAFNFSNEIQLTVLELVKKIIKLMKSSLKPLILNAASHEIRHQYLSSKKAKELLGWKPKFDLETGLNRTIDFYRDFLK